MIERDGGEGKGKEEVSKEKTRKGKKEGKNLLEIGEGEDKGKLSLL